MRLDKLLLIEFVTNKTSGHFHWRTEEMLGSGMAASTLMLLILVFMVLTIILSYIIKEIYIYLHWKDLKGKVVLITGGANGIGKLIAKKCCQLGSKVAIWDINEEQLNNTVSELSVFGKVYGYKVDITDYNKVYEMAAKVKQDIGSSVDILVNNAGVVMGKSLLNATEKEIMLTLNVNTLSHFWTARAFLPDMIEKREGHIVTVASACGVAATSGMPDYVTSKFAVIGFNDALRVELKQNPKTANIRTLCVCPYYINTGMFKGVKNGLLPLLEPEYVANRIVNSIQRCDEMLVMPWACKTAYLVKFLLPVWMQDLGLDLMGVTRSMQSFKGRTEKSHITTMKKLVNKTDIDS